jgi:hypothetical protein
MKYRMYIDEVGNSDMGASEDPNHRYLSLTGIIMEIGYVGTTVFPRIEEIKRSFFGSHPDDPIIFHRKELINKKFPFEKLKNKDVETQFNSEFLSFLSDTSFHVITVVIDKLEHKQKYQVWLFDPYHYCLSVLVERYVLWLKKHKITGDVMAESRGGKEDIRLKNSFEALLNAGNDYIKPSDFHQALTSKQLKIKAKSCNVSGLQVADLVAHPSYRAMKLRREAVLPKLDFGTKIVQILEKNKYVRSDAGQIDGWGRKWLP